MTTKTLSDSTTTTYYYSGSGVTLVNVGIQGATGASGLNFGFVVAGNNDTLINNGTVFGQRVGVYVTGSGDSVINAAGKKIIATLPDQAGVNFYNFRGTLTNYGVISGYANAVNGGPAGNAVELEHGGIVTNAGTLLNGGVLVGGSTGTVINSGVILGSSAYGGVYMRFGGQVTNLVGGVISANGATASYQGAPPYGVFIHGGAGTVINAGTINGSTGNAVELATGFQNRLIVDPGAVFVGTVTGGTAADATLELASAASTGTLSGFGTQFTNFGTVTLDPSASWLIKASTAVTAAVINGFAANDTLDLAGFVAVSRTFASNALVLTNASSASVTLHIQGSLATSNFTIGGDGAGGTDIAFSAGTVAALAYGQTIDETGIVATSETVTAGTMTLFNGASPVGTVAVGTSLSSGDFLLRSDGAVGTDVIVNTVFGTYTSGVTLLANPTTIAGTAKITGSLASVVGVGGPPGTAWTLTNQGLVSETGANSDGVSLASAGTVINAATITGGVVAGSGIVLAAGGSVTNQSGGTIRGFDGIYALSNPATVVNAGVIAGSYTTNGADGVYLQAGGSVTNQSSGRITGDNNAIRITGARGTVVNLGTVQSNDIPGQNGGAGIYLADGGAVTNGASGGTASSAYILGYRYGVAFGASAAGTLTNFGTISGNPGNPAVLLTTGTIINGPGGATGALIEGGDQVSAVLIAGVGTVVNYAKIIGVENPGDTALYYGVRLGGASDRISNLGNLALIENYIGVYATDNDTVTNAGTIASNYAGGRDALVFGGGTNRLIIDPGARFIGTVSGSGPVTLAPSGNSQVIGTANGIGVTTLELASASNAGTLHGLGVQYVGFAAVTVDMGANWTLSAANTLAAGVTLTNAGTLTDSGTLTNAGRITGAAKGIVLTTGARLTNQSAGTIATGSIAVSASGAATVVNAGLISGNFTVTGDAGVYLAAGGLVTNQAGGTISGDIAVYAKAAAATLINAGSITGGSVMNSDGVDFRTGGLVSNQSGGVISGYGAILLAGAAGTVVNAGGIIGNPAGGTGVYLQFGGSVTNQAGGTISGGADAVKLAAGHTNRLVIDPNATFTGSVDGGNTIGAASVSTLELASGAGTGTLAGLGTQFIDFAQVTVDASAAWMFSGTQSGFATLANAGSIIAGVTLGAGAFTVSNQSGGTIAGASGLYALGVVTVANAGSIAGNVTAGSGIMLTAGGTVTNLTGGTISGSYGVGAISVAATVVNAGTIGDGASLSTGIGIALKAGGSITNQSGGRIIARLQGVYIGGGAGSVINAGSIGGSPTSGNGILFASGGVVSNQSGGVITGLYGVRAVTTAVTVSNYGDIGGNLTTGAGVNLAAGGAVTNQSGGTITGLRGAMATGGAVVNAGSIGGNAAIPAGVGVQLLSGGSVTNRAGGAITGFVGVYGGAGAATVVNAGSIGGNPALGKGIYLEAGGTVTNQSGGTISGGADAVLFASSFTNRLVVDPGATFIGSVDGRDTPGSILISTLELAAGAGTLSGLGTQFIGFAAVTIDAGANWTLSGTNTLAAGATLTNAGTLTDTGTLFNSGTLTGNRLNLDGGALTNQASGVLTATYVYGVVAGGTDIVVNQGAMTNAASAAIYLKGGSGDVTNAAGGAITGYGDGVRLNGTDASVSNLGQITGTGVNPGYGVYMRNGGVVTNGQGGAGTSTAAIQGYYGIAFKSFQTDIVSNYGTIIGTGADDGWGVWLSGNDGSVANGQSGATGALIQGGRFGVYSGVGPVINEATIIATGTFSGDYGVEIDGEGSLSNLGSASLIAGYGGVRIELNGTITNAGTIESNQGTAGVAVRFGGGDARLIDDPGAVFIGSINGGSGGTAVLELASGSSGGLLAGFGTTVTNFTSLIFDSGSAWTVAGNDSANGLGTLGIGGFTINDTIDLTGFVAASRTFAGSTLTLTAAGGAQETLTFQGAFTTGNFVISSDGNAGTDVSFFNFPVISGTAAGQPVTDEATVHPFSGVTIGDANIGSQAETVTITLTNGGTVTGADGTLSGAGVTRTAVGIYTLSAASAGTITTALDALVFTPTAHQVAPGDTVTTGFAIEVTDTAGGTSSDGATTVIATAVNDHPVITGAITGQTTTDKATVTPFSAVTISDPDIGASETIIMTLNVDGSPSDTNGTLSGSGLTETVTGIYTLTAGTPADVTTELQALVFTPAILDLPPDTTATTDMTLSVSDGIAGSPTTDTNTSVVIVPCFAAGTRIATPRGVIAVERLREGDTVLTISGKPQVIQWIGCRTLDCNRHISPERVKPIRIAPHAFGENRPRRALLLSPDHSVFVEDVLIPIKHLLNDTTVTQIDVATVTYYHLELPRHDVVLAEGLPAETYLETGARFAFENGGGAMELHPNFAPDEARVGMVWRNFSYAPLIGTDGQLDRVRARLALQALMLDQQANAAPQPGKRLARRSDQSAVQPR